jgi:hypothetical protein
MITPAGIGLQKNWESFKTGRFHLSIYKKTELPM